MNCKQAIVIIPAGEAPQANEIARQINPEGGDNFSIALALEETPEDISYYACSWLCNEKEYEFLEISFEDFHSGEDIRFPQLLELKGLVRWEDGSEE